MNFRVGFNVLALNWKSAIAVSFISMPLAVSLAVASHATPVQVVITAIWAGLMAAIFGSSNYNVIGPTGALSGLLSGYCIIHGAHILPTLAIISGLMIFIAYCAGLDKYLAFIPSGTIAGFVLGVACIIIANQMNFACGLHDLPTHPHLLANILESFKHIFSSSLSSCLIFLLVFGLLVFLSKVVPQIPGALIICPFAIAFGFLTSRNIIPLHLDTLESKFSSLTPHIYNTWSFSFSWSLIIPALTIAIIAILETMISARIADDITKTKHNKNRELLGLSIANIFSGLAGGIPATAALARTTFNIKSGCTHKMSAGASSICIIIISFIFLSFFKFMPLAAIAAILTLVGINMIDVEDFKTMFRKDRTNFCIALAVALVTIVEDPIVGILLGATASMLVLMKKMSTGLYELNHIHTLSHIPQTAYLPADSFVYSIKGALVYVNAQAHVERLEKQVIEPNHVILDLNAVSFIDSDGFHACEEIIELLKTKNKQVRIIGPYKLLSSMNNHAPSLEEHFLKPEGPTNSHN